MSTPLQPCLKCRMLAQTLGYSSSIVDTPWFARCGACGFTAPPAKTMKHAFANWDQANANEDHPSFRIPL